MGSPRSCASSSATSIAPTRPEAGYSSGARTSALITARTIASPALADGPIADRGEAASVVITVAGMLGSVSTSYVRARAEAVGITCTVGWITRPERIIILTLGLIFGQLFAAIVILFVLATLTVIQRTAHVHRMVREQNLPSMDETDSSH